MDEQNGKTESSCSDFTIEPPLVIKPKAFIEHVELLEPVEED